jgi:hypothetical protein
MTPKWYFGTSTAQNGFYPSSALSDLQQRSYPTADVLAIDPNTERYFRQPQPELDDTPRPRVQSER